MRVERLSFSEVLLFVFYAVAVWYGAVRWRYNWRAFAWVTGGLLGVLAVIQFHVLLNAWTNYEIYLPVLQTLLWSYLLLVGMVGFFIACIPHARKAWCCERCHYDLTGVPGFASVCPECGTPIDDTTLRAAEQRAQAIVAAPKPAARSRAPRDMADLLSHSSIGRENSASHEPPDTPHEKDADRYAEHQRPSKG